MSDSSNTGGPAALSWRRVEALEAEIIKLKKLIEVQSTNHVKENADGVCEKETSNQSKVEGAELVILTTVSSFEMNQLREFVGALHSLRESNVDVHMVVVYGFQLTGKEEREIRLWRNVEYFDAAVELSAGQKIAKMTLEPATATSIVALQYAEITVLNALDICLSKYRSVLYVRNEFSFQKDSLHSLNNLIHAHGLVVGNVGGVNGSVPFMGFKAQSEASWIFVDYPLQCLRGYQCPQNFHRRLRQRQRLYIEQGMGLEDAGLAPTKKDAHQAFCSVLLRDDILYSFELDRSMERKSVFQSDSSSSTLASRPVIAIGMPTMSSSSLASFEDVAPIKIFMPSFIKSVEVEEWEMFRYAVYIGYDENDRFFDNENDRAAIYAHLCAIVITHLPSKVTSTLPKQGDTYNFDSILYIEFVKFPFSKGWVTYLWNGLFTLAMSDGCDYFYQVNDDLELQTTGWSTLFVGELGSHNGFGVAGPLDPFLHGRILTQAFVGRIHFSIFGRFYPLDIKDWYSDNWITDVYGPDKYLVQSVRVLNKNDQGTRYTVCDQPKYAHILENGRKVIEAWKTLDSDAYSFSTGPLTQ